MLDPFKLTWLITLTLDNSISVKLTSDTISSDFNILSLGESAKTLFTDKHIINKIKNTINLFLIISPPHN